jgi:DNA-binding response OmpR family regulator
MRLLVIEDSQRLRESLVTGLRHAGYAVDACADGSQGLWSAASNPYDVIVLDLMLPAMDGLSVLRAIRTRQINSHVLILTAKDELQDKVAGLRSGADDYLVKPFAFDELLARIEALLRRQHGAKNPVIEIGSIRIDTRGRSVTRGDERIELTARQYTVLEYLALRRGQTVSRTDIEAHAYDERVEPMSNVVDTVVYALRKKLDRPGGPSLVRTRRGMGYELVTDVT